MTTKIMIKKNMIYKINLVEVSKKMKKSLANLCDISSLLVSNKL